MIFSAFVIIGFNQTAFSNESKITSQIYYPGTRWTKPDNLVGASKIELNTNNNESINVVEFAEEIFQMPVRVGQPLGMVGLSEYTDDASFATAVGLLQYGKMQFDNKKTSKQRTTDGLWKRVQSWFKGEF